MKDEQFMTLEPSEKLDMNPKTVASERLGKLSKHKIYFAGLLANVDSSILNVKLGHGFEIEGMPEDKGNALFSALENLPYYETHTKLFMQFPCLNSSERKYFVISNSLEAQDELGDKSFSKVIEFENKMVDGYLEPTLRLMRLFKEGNIFMPFEYFFYLKGDIPTRVMSKGRHWHISRELYSLENSEISHLENFIKSTKLPFRKPFLQLAFENFELSYHVQSVDLSFVSLMISLEALFNRGDREIAYTIARNTAVLLGDNVTDSKDIFSKMTQLYRKRSKIIHIGKRGSVTQEELLRLRYYARESIKQIYKLGKSKEEALDLLNTLGFGQKSALSSV